MKVTFIAVLINTLHSTLEDTKIAFNRVCMNFPANIITFAVRCKIVICKLRTKFSVLLRFIRIHNCFFSNIFTQYRQ